MSPHTPGPWTAEYHVDGEWTVGGNGDLVAVVYRALGKREKGQTVANARLIAKAPEMMKELLQSRAGFAVVMNHTLPNEAVHGLAKENFDRLGALLREIEGEKS